SPDGALLAGFQPSSTLVYVWNAANGVELRRKLMYSKTTCFAFSRDAKTLVVGSGQLIYFWDIATGEVKNCIEGPPGDCFRLALSPNGSTLATLVLKEPQKGADRRRDNHIYLWETSTGKKLRQIEVLPVSTRIKASAPEID